jgi:hypothetical protein
MIGRPIVSGGITIVATLVMMSSNTVFASTPQPSPTPTPTQPPLSVVQQLCVPAGIDETVYEWNFAPPYLLCIISDQLSGTGKLFMQNPDGTFSRISHGGGAVNVDLMVNHYGVPTAIAKALRVGLHP